ncbi:putative membrane protein [Methanofollis sp. W23]|uniref:heparan-alpha-glucosaminide N-acetyltransferase n=1 Tax=Methanofollis sp. W23 TaxID=2817849 RepID=UPI001DEB576A|nr:heparan-alpha-glucosaminide N-acetyltransferase [Methanofollis sp. W23]MBP2145609.1 putative membrane protein [Methanofollis sp. W23]
MGCIVLTPDMPHPHQTRVQDLVTGIFSTHSAGRRFLEIDLLRGVAILMMVLYHFLFDLSFFGIADVEVHTGVWKSFALATASLFIALAGLSLPISYARRKDRLSGQALWADYARRGGKIFLYGLLVTLATWLYLGDGFVVFGILHLIGFAIIVAPFFLRFGLWNFLIGATVVLASVPLAGVNGPYWLLWLGVHPASFYSVDYVPVIPWLGVALIGMAIGFWLYPDGKRRFGVPEVHHWWADLLSLFGRNSLFIYLVHQPVIVGVMMALGLVA